MALSIGLDTAVKALRAHQLAVDVAAHNIANAHSPGFSRQRVLLRPMGLDGSDHFTRDALLGRAGFGVNASDVNRVRDVFMDYQVRQTIGSQGQYQMQSGALSRAELVFNDPSDGGMSGLLANFWNAWHDVANDPEGSPGRTQLVHATTTLTSRIQRSYSDLESQRKDLNFQVRQMADEINSYAGEVAQLNFQIKQVELNGDMANDLRDRRDLMLDKLSGIANISYNEMEDSTVTVYLGSHELVFSNTARAVSAVDQPGNAGMQYLTFDQDGMPVEATTGKLKGLYDARDIDLPNLLAKLDTFASELIASVNAAHNAGTDLDGNAGGDFFAPTPPGSSAAATIAINPSVAGNPRSIASSGSGAPGDGSVALQIANIQLNGLAGLNGQTFDDFYGNIVTVLGADVSRANGLAQSATDLNAHFEGLRQSVSGVNIDEEVTNLAAAQHAYEAAARVITAIDQMLETLINGTGVVGR
jgi:flagellar hook-associated protein 1